MGRPKKPRGRAKKPPSRDDALIAAGKCGRLKDKWRKLPESKWYCQRFAGWGVPDKSEGPCRRHGGHTPKGAENHQFKTGAYSEVFQRVFTKDEIERYHASLADPNRFALDPHLGLVDVLLLDAMARRHRPDLAVIFGQLAKRLSGASAVTAKLETHLDRFMDAGRKGDEVGMKREIEAIDTLVRTRLRVELDRAHSLQGKAVAEEGESHRAREQARKLARERRQTIEARNRKEHVERALLSLEEHNAIMARVAQALQDVMRRAERELPADHLPSIHQLAGWWGEALLGERERLHGQLGVN